MMVIFYETYCTYQWEATLGTITSSFIRGQFNFRKTYLRHENRPRKISQPLAMGARQSPRENSRVQEARSERSILPLAVQKSLGAADGSRTHDTAFQQNEKGDL